ncbi:hypothetical protein CO683_00845 [Bradyrhizobium ottawaense]|uniref:hypothetical protein n=1 Tax=Bradyrhizobium ottawaense TaxID=931866 RepID=UPI000BE8FB38|nr:hypothetical protein [Bradyrhizobium ottawaense]PDT71739.1 hypothetical protein CO683_00845 [Bradyrhizobium ottawaense]
MGLETLALVAGIGGSVLSGAGAIQKGQAAKQAADYNAAVDAQRAAEERDRAQADTQDYIRKGSNTVEAGRALRGVTGVTNEGSPLLVDEATVREVALGAARTLHGGELRASRLEDDAKLQKMKGEHAVTASYLDAGSSLLTSAGKFGKGGYSSGATY